MRLAVLSIPVAMTMVLGACEETPKSIEYWMAHKEELREMERVCLTNGATKPECENVARASSRIATAASKSRIDALRAARGE